MAMSDVLIFVPYAISLGSLPHPSQFWECGASELGLMLSVFALCLFRCLKSWERKEQHLQD